ncbi:MAG TPA: hypothetical protein VFT27_08815 [Actinomycetota bacterium]|nr:hypothetical protein [Actinomycetota bacterium]
MPIDPACQPIADSIATLQATRDSIQAGLPPMAPLDRWKGLAQMGDLSRQIAELQIQLDSCQRQHAASYEAEVVIFDISGGPPTTRQASLWHLDPAGASVLEQTTLSGAGLSFTPPSVGPVGITIQQTNPSVRGLDFRSGPLEELPRKSTSDPAGRVEIVLGPVLTFTSDQIEGWLSALSLPQHTSTPLNTPLFSASADIVWSAVGMRLATGTMRFTASGTVTVTGPLVGTQSAPFSLELPIRFGLPVTPGSGIGCEVLMAANPNPSLTVGGQLGAIVNPIAPFFFDFCGGAALGALRSELNDVLEESIARLFGLADLTRVPVVSLRHFDITPSAVTIQPALGAFGDLLSTYLP